MPAEGCRTFTLESMKKECAPKQYECHEVPKEEVCCDKPVTVCGSGYGVHLIGWLIVLWIIIAIILFFVQPNFIFRGRRGGFGNNDNCDRDGKHSRSRSHEEEEEGSECENRRNRCVNWGSLILWALVIAIIIIVLIWLFRTFAQGFY